MKIEKVIEFVLICGLIIILCGCANKEPEIISRTSYQDVNMPVRCEVELPPKPSFDETNPSTAGDVAAYYEEVERLLLLCIGVKNE